MASLSLYTQPETLLRTLKEGAKYFIEYLEEKTKKKKYEPMRQSHIICKNA